MAARMSRSFVSLWMELEGSTHAAVTCAAGLLGKTAVIDLVEDVPNVQMQTRDNEPQ